MQGEDSETQPLMFSNGGLAVLEDYFRHYLLDNERHTISRPELSLRLLAALFGAGWGTPWTQAASGAALIFPDNVSRKIFANIFAGGIVVTVGADGLWIMLEIGKSLGAKTALEKKLTAKESGRCIKISKITFPALFALLSCIPSVYATVKYNTGAKKFLGIITLVGNYGNGFYGYHKLLEAIFGKIDSKRNGTQVLDARKARILANIDNVIRGTLEVTDKEMLIRNIMDFSAVAENNVSECNILSARKSFQAIFTLAIASSSSLVDIFLTKEFLAKNILKNGFFDYVTAIVSEVPSAVVTCISSYFALGRFFDFLRCRSDDPITQLTKEMYPKTMFSASFLLLLLSLTAPTAAAYITYSTLGGENIDKGMQWSATAAMIAARLLFSNFTLNNLVKDAALTLHGRNYPADNPLNVRGSAIRLKDITANANILYFQQGSERLPAIASTSVNTEDELPRVTPREWSLCTIL